MKKERELLICPRCFTVHKKLPLKKQYEARCQKCDEILLRHYPALEWRVLVLSISGIIFLLLALFFPLVDIDIGGIASSFNMIDTIIKLWEDGYLLIALFVSLVLVLFPLLLIIALLMLSIAMIVKQKRLARNLLILVTTLSHWSMLDIFFVSILVALVKIYEYAQIRFDTAFLALAFFIIIEIYLTRYIKLEWYWERWEEL